MNHKYYTTKSYSHLNIEERKIIQRLYNTGYSCNYVAKLLNRSRNTISLEIKRNGKLNQPSINSKRVGTKTYSYFAITAHNKYNERRSNNTKYDFTTFKTYINNDTNYHLTFNQLILNFKKDNSEYGSPCFKTMYNWYHKGYFKYDVIPKKIKKYRKLIKRNRKNSRISIHKRTFKMNNYTTKGHYEIDTIYSGDKKGGVLTLNERATMMLYSTIIPDRKALTIVKALKHIIYVNDLNIKSITSDNGMEFTLFKYFTRNYNLKWYFADPYCSGQRGQNERLNRDVRMFYGKGCIFHDVCEQEYQKRINDINNIPRQKFDGLSANEKSVML